MAHRSQHPVQIMEDKNRFDLEKALRAWREDCASRPGISLEDSRELESDLRERVRDLQKQGLSENEAFQEGARQLGSPGALAREFARENPWAVWQDRLLWMVVAGFAISIWHFMTNGAIVWLFQWYSQTFDVSPPFSFGAWVTLAGNLPVLAIAVLLATGRLEKLRGRLHYLLQSRQRLALVGMGLLVAGVLTRGLGPNPVTPPGGIASTALSLMNLSAWPLLLLSLGVFILEPVSAGEEARLRFQMASVPAAVWRSRVCWMVVGGLVLEFWQTVSLFGIRALFYTGNIAKPFNVSLALMSVNLLLQLSPLILLVLLRQRMRRGKAIPGATLVRRRPLLAILPALLCVWTGLHLWSVYSWMPREFGASWPGLFTHYATTFRWFWPVSLAALLLWLAPNQSEHQDSEFAT